MEYTLITLVKREAIKDLQRTLGMSSEDIAHAMHITTEDYEGVKRGAVAWVFPEAILRLHDLAVDNLGKGHEEVIVFDEVFQMQKVRAAAHSNQLRTEPQERPRRERKKPKEDMTQKLNAAWAEAQKLPDKEAIGRMVGIALKAEEKSAGVFSKKIGSNPGSFSTYTRNHRGGMPLKFYAPILVELAKLVNPEGWFTQEKYEQLKVRMDAVLATQAPEVPLVKKEKPSHAVAAAPASATPKKVALPKAPKLPAMLREIQKCLSDGSGNIGIVAIILQGEINNAIKEVYERRTGKTRLLSTNENILSLDMGDAKALIAGKWMPPREVLEGIDYWVRAKNRYRSKEPAQSLVKLYDSHQAAIDEEAAPMNAAHAEAKAAAKTMVRRQISS